MAGTDEALQRVITALERVDAQSRLDRAQRIVGLSTLPAVPNVLLGRQEQLDLLEEVRTCFIEGRYIAVLLTATAFVEHTLSEELLLIGCTKLPRTVEGLIDEARKRGIANTGDLLDRAHKLRLVRNPFGHFRLDGDPDRLATRVRALRRHPRQVLEADAKAAVSIVYELLVATMREVEL